MEVDSKKFDFTYIKEDNHKLFKSLEDNNSTFGILEPQNYNPLYNNFFELSKTNNNNIILNHNWILQSISSQETNNIFDCKVTNKDIKEKRKTYLKFSPLIDPIKYLLGKYDMKDESLLKLPLFESNNTCHPKSNTYNNTAYIDSFFTYLSSKLLHDHGFVNGMDFYGSFLAKKSDFRINIVDDIEYLNDSLFFRKNDKVLYELEYIDMDDFNSDTRNYKKKLNVEDDTQETLLLDDITDITEDTCENTCEGSNEKELEIITLDDLDLDLIKNSNKISESTHDGSCSSRSSNTTTGDGDGDGDGEEENSDDGDGDNDGNDDDSDYTDCSDEDEDDEDDEDDEEEIIAKIKEFPVQVIALEHCENTLDHIMMNGTITNELWDSIVIQILFSLITFQNTFGLTHNDLHTNNIMYIKTDKPFLYYKLNHVYYKVPTYGKIFKIIDFGRAIYKFRGKLLCSDSYHPEGDAATQYNCEPYFNDKKPLLEPNMSFDLCRLGCALYDFLIDEPKSKIVQIMLNWVKDDKGRNILYKKNGDERYPDFKLYKMIARSVNKHVPVNVLNNSYFDKYIVTKKDLKKKKIMDLDAIPCYM